MQRPQQQRPINEPLSGAPPTLAQAAARALLFLRRNLTHIALAGTPIGLALFTACFFYFDKYSATALIMVDPRESKVTERAGVIGGIGPDGNAIESLALIARSETFLGALVDRYDLTQDSFFRGKGANEAAIRDATIEKLRNNSNVSRHGTTWLIEATFNSPSAEQAAKLANAAAQKIIDDQSKIRAGADSSAAQDIAGRLSDMRARVARAEEAAAELKATLKVTDAGQGSTLLERRVYELNQQWALAAAKTAEARARFAQLRKAQDSAHDDVAPSKQSAVLNTLRQDFARLTQKFAEESTVLGARHPEVLSLKAQLADVKRQIGAELARMLATARTETLEAEQREAQLAAALKQAEKESGDLGPQMARLDELEREAKAERSIYEELLKRQRELTESGSLEQSDIRLVSAAVPPARTSPKLSLLAAGCAALGLIGGLAYALAREMLRNTLKTPQDAERLAGVTVAGFAPLLVEAEPAAAGRFTPDLAPWLGDICAALASAIDEGEPRAILVSSARAGEGRTTIAVNVARHFAQGGASVLLIEADCGRDDLAKRRFGLIDILEQGEGLRQAFIERASEGYTLLPFGGRLVDDTTQTAALMSGVTLRATLQVCREWFDLVVIDGPAALHGGHARLLAREADLALCVVAWDETSSAEVDEALDRLGVEEALVVFNKVDVARFRLFDPVESRRLEAQAPQFQEAA
ncbi:MAG TPA: polysaccharide biosynthesis tyrosine autokinase [Methylocystis sp.]|nr:polysaccharide biosynthesis tyrosine autokinase [Methylocystis sp.]